METTAAFKRSLQISDDKAREIERNTHEQRLSSLWFSVRQYRITSSLFGNVLTRRATTPPDSLVLRIQSKRFSTAATVIRLVFAEFDTTIGHLQY